MNKLLGLVLLGCAAAADAASEQDVRRAFEQAQKKGAVAVVEERCSGSTVHFAGSTAEQITKVSAALTAFAATRAEEVPLECPGGLHPGEARYLELYPDGTVKTRGK